MRTGVSANSHILLISLPAEKWKPGLWFPGKAKDEGLLGTLFGQDSLVTSTVLYLIISAQLRLEILL